MYTEIVRLGKDEVLNEDTGPRIGDNRQTMEFRRYNLQSLVVYTSSL